jgi:hypothetical protein
MITVIELVKEFKDNRIMNTKNNPNAVSDYIKEKVKITEYIPFIEKRIIAEMVVRKNTTIVNGYKKNDAINQYVSFVIAMIQSHTDIEISKNPIADYDLLAESGLLAPIVDMFKTDYTECDIVLKLALTAELEDNNVNAMIGKLLGGISGILDVVKDKLEDLDLNEIIGDYFDEDDLAKLSSFLHR